MLRLFVKIWVHFQAFKNLYPAKKWENMQKNLNFEKKFGFGKKKFGSDTDTEIQPWFRFPIPIPNFGRTLVSSSWVITFLSAKTMGIRTHEF